MWYICSTMWETNLEEYEWALLISVITRVQGDLVLEAEPPVAGLRGMSVLVPSQLISDSPLSHLLARVGTRIWEWFLWIFSKRVPCRWKTAHPSSAGKEATTTIDMGPHPPSGNTAHAGLSCIARYLSEIPNNTVILKSYLRDMVSAGPPFT